LTFDRPRSRYGGACVRPGERVDATPRSETTLSGPPQTLVIVGEFDRHGEWTDQLRFRELGNVAVGDEIAVATDEKAGASLRKGGRLASLIEPEPENADPCDARHRGLNQFGDGLFTLLISAAGHAGSAAARRSRKPAQRVLRTWRQSTGSRNHGSVIRIICSPLHY
jgi:hypothetical protein